MTKLTYALFAGSSYYASGGWLDFRGFHPTVHDAIDAGKRLCKEDPNYVEWFHVVDTEQNNIVAFKLGDHCGGSNKNFFPANALEVE